MSACLPGKAKPATPYQTNVAGVLGIGMETTPTTYAIDKNKMVTRPLISLGKV